MTAFQDTPQDQQRLDFALLRHGAISLYYRHDVLAGDVAWLHAQRYKIHELDASGWHGAEQFHDGLRRALGSPHRYGANLAAFLDCMADLNVPAESGTALVFRHYDVFARGDPRLALLVLDAIESTSRYNLLFGRRLIALVQSDDPRIRFEAVGSRPVNWNPREWLEETRPPRGAGAAS
ncbi:MAG TPA: barstar family protein [Gemmatimonadaceae bacterium]|nr:barstar family protein [Gemmatimonadaceae bacterium]